jgi:hypothetical protein
MSDYFDRIERQLMARVPAQANAGIGWRRMRLLVRRPRLDTVSAVIATLITVAVAGAFTVLLAAHRTSRPAAGSSDTAPVQGTRPVSAGLRRSFPVLSRPRSAADDIPALVATGLIPTERRLGLELSQSRLVIAMPTETDWLVPGRRALCILRRENHQSSTGGGGCDSVANAEKTGFIWHTEHTVAGVLPVGSSAVAVTRTDGSSVKLKPNKAGAVALSSARPLSAVSWTGADGVAHHLTVRSATPPTP